MRILGVDPGSRSGAWALIAPAYARVGDLPVVKDGVNAAEFLRLLQELQPTVAVVERVGAMPGQGISSTFTFGRAYGTILGVLASAGVEVELVVPTQWKKHFSLPGKDKEIARQVAIQRFPGVTGLELKKHHGRAEALLLAKYWQEKHRAAASA